jgi:hypothetical protein
MEGVQRICHFNRETCWCRTVKHEHAPVQLTTQRLAFQAVRTGLIDRDNWSDRYGEDQRVDTRIKITTTLSWWRTTRFTSKPATRYSTHLCGEERLVYEQTNKDRRNSHPGGTPSECECRQCALGRPASLRTSSLVVKISRWETYRVWRRDKREKLRNNRFNWVMVALNRPWPFICIGWRGLPREKQKTHTKPT